MNLVLRSEQLPLRLITETPMSDDDLMRFCAANEGLRAERDANGELIVMSPAGSESSGGGDTGES